MTTTKTYKEKKISNVKSYVNSEGFYVSMYVHFHAYLQDYYV